MRRSYTGDYEIFTCLCMDYEHHFRVDISDTLEFSFTNAYDRMPFLYRLKHVYDFITKKTDSIEVMGIEFNGDEKKLFYQAMRAAEKQLLKRPYIPRHVEPKNKKRTMIRTSALDKPESKIMTKLDFLLGKLRNKIPRKVYFFLSTLTFRYSFSKQIFYLDEEYHLFKPSEDYEEHERTYLVFSREKTDTGEFRSCNNDISICKVIHADSEMTRWERFRASWHYLIGHRWLKLNNLFDIRTEDLDRFFNVIYKFLEEKYPELRR